MQVDTIEALLKGAFPDARVAAELNGNHATVTVIDEVFEGQRAVKRQQQVYACLNELIASGELHAVNIVAQTPAEAG